MSYILYKRRINVQKILFYLSGFIGLGAYLGGAVMFLSPNGAVLGLDAILPHMQILPFAELLFRDFTFSAIMLILVNGVCNTVAVVGLATKRGYGVICSLLAAVMLLCWLGVQWVVFAINPLTTIYTVLGIIQLSLSWSLIKCNRKNIE